MSIDVELTIKGEVSRLHLGPDDKVVVNVDRPVTPEQVDRIAQTVKAIFPDHQILVLAEGITVEVVGPEGQDSALAPEPTE